MRSNIMPPISSMENLGKYKKIYVRLAKYDILYNPLGMETVPKLVTHIDTYGFR